MNRRFFFASGGAVAAGGLLGAAPSGAGASAAHEFIPDVEVVDQDGRRSSFYRDLVRDRVVLLNVFFTSCGDTCPLVTQNLREVQDRLGDRVGRDILMLSISLQPELETPAVLKDYASIWDVKPGWRFLTGAPQAVADLRRALGFSSSANGLDAFETASTRSRTTTPASSVTATRGWTAGPAAPR